MITLNSDKIKRMLHEETVKTEEQATILRSIYLRYMNLYEQYFADIDALDDAEIAELRMYHEETKSLIKYYYMDIPYDTCLKLREFEKEYSSNLLGSGWHAYLSDSYKAFQNKSENQNKSKKMLKEEFTKQVLDDFYDIMDYIFREGFGTDSQTVKSVISGIKGLFLEK